MIRLFVGLTLPLSVRDQLHALMIGIPGARWIAPQSYHITLRFIGNISENDADDLHTACAAIQAAPFPLEIAGTGAFSKGQRVHSLWAGLKHTPLLFALRDKVEQAVVRTRTSLKTSVVTTRRYAPHITLARLDCAPITRVQQFLTASHLFRAGPFRVDRFILFASHFSRDGVFYEPIADYPLKKVGVTRGICIPEVNIRL